MGIINHLRRKFADKSIHFNPSESRSVDLAARGEGAAVEQVALGAHEVGVTSDVGLRVEPRHDLLEELGSRRGITAVHGAVEGELGEPDLVDAVLVAEVDGLGDEALQVLGLVAVPVDANGADVAVRAAVHERLQPVETLAGIVAVGDRGADECGLAGVRRDVLLVGLDSFGGGHAGLAGVVGLVEAKDVVAAAGEGGLDRRRPAAEHLAAPELGYELDALWDEAVGEHVPVIRPRDSVCDRFNHRHIVVGGATLVV